MEIILYLEVIDILFSGLNIFSLSQLAFYSALSRFPSPWLLFIFFFGFLFSDFILTYLVGVFVFVCVHFVCLVHNVLGVEYRESMC